MDEHVEIEGLLNTIESLECLESDLSRITDNYCPTHEMILAVDKIAESVFWVNKHIEHLRR